MPRMYIASKTIDPVIGIASGLWAYYIAESKHPRPQGHSLPELLQTKWNDRNLDRTSTLHKEVIAEDSEGWSELNAELTKWETTQQAKS